MATPSLSPSQREKFISNLVLPDRPPKLRSLTFAPTRGTEPTTFVDAGSIVTFAGPVTQQSRQDVLNSMLLAQLAADKRYSRDADIENWFKFYADVFAHLGWALGAATFNKYDAHGRQLDVDKAILEVLTAIVTQNELAAIVAAIQAAKQLAGNDGRITLFDHFTSHATAGAFQVGVACEQQGVVSLKLGAFHYSSHTKVTQVLWFKFSASDSDVSFTRQAVTLNSEVYLPLRAVVQQKLGQDTSMFIAGL